MFKHSEGVPKTSSSTFRGQTDFHTQTTFGMNDFLKISTDSKTKFNVKQDDFLYINKIHKIDHIRSNKANASKFLDKDKLEMMFRRSSYNKTNSKNL
jgi:hypothetical protein